MYALLLLAVMALTGLTWSFGWYRTGFYSLFGAETRAQQSSHGDSSPQRQERNKPDGSESETTFAHWEQVVKTLQERNPGHAQITVADGNATVAFSRLGNQRASDRYTFDPLTGELQDAEPYETTPRPRKAERLDILGTCRKFRRNSHPCALVSGSLAGCISPSHRLLLMD